MNSNAEHEEAGSDSLEGVFYQELDEYFSIFRFFEDGTVISASIAKVASLENTWALMRGWFDHNYNNSGTYHLVGHQLEFSTTSSYGRVDYCGQYLGAKLILNVYSHINQRQFIEREYLRLEGWPPKDE